MPIVGMNVAAAEFLLTSSLGKEQNIAYAFSGWVFHRSKIVLSIVNM